MAQDKVSVLEGALLRGADAVIQAKQETDSELRGIQDLVSEIRGYWTGPAATAYTQMQTQFNETSSRLNNVLVTLEQNLRSTDRSQKATESSQDDQIAAIARQIG
ncbi:MAG: WXG100 family type VII secretion target [Bifidobacteriaceae bacterium]|nr:WXG100 family type VII secretion target [Bifidobacteriaceae bacterium]